MRVASRQDLLLLAGLVTVALIVFSEPLWRLLEHARDVEQASGLTLVPALFLLIAVSLVHLLRKRGEIDAAALAAQTAKHAAEERARELERLVTFGHALARSLDRDAIRAAVAEHLPRIAGTDQVWVLLQKANEWELLLGDQRGDADLAPRVELAARCLSGVHDMSADAGTAGFPLIVGGSAVGVIGVQIGDAGLDPDPRRALEAAAALLAVSLKNADLFREVREHSLRDALTGCFTRPHAMDVIDAELRRARRSQFPVSLVMFDLDHFKDVNDRYGHLCGDTVLSTVGRRMRDVLRGSDLRCRYGGEEFLVLLPETPLHGARRVAETLRREIADRPIPWAGDALTITASFGITQALPAEVNIQALIARADAALYRAKDEGRNCVRIASDTLTVVPRDRKPHLA
ncbi:MAG: sensor domain-containing diguanylate cyclase [Acidobacteria bacterium]|nr:sensor domain-containing diguanylate cyclase [Acidobacteriota bacterium]